jgi:single-strand DNA-binding protein
MNSLKNRVQLIGNLGMDPEVKELNSGKKMVKFSLATSETYKNNEGKKVTDTQWHNIVGWEGVASIAEKYLKKGSHVAVDGKLTHRNYEDANGQKRYFTEVVISEIMMLKNKNETVFE